MSTFQAVTYGSFVLTFILAAFAAVVLLRKAMDITERRFSGSAKALAGALLLMSMYGFFATYSYARYLRQESHTAPVSLTLLFWIILGATIGYLINRLLGVKDKVDTTEVIIDGLSYAAIFILITLAVSAETSTNTSLILALVALVAYTLPFARCSIAYKSVKFRHPELQHKSIKRLLSSLILLPALVVVIAVLYVFDAFGPDTMLLGTNLISSSFVLFVSFALFSSLKALTSQPAGETAAAEAKTTATAPRMDPLVEELLAEEKAAKAEAAHQAEAAPRIKPLAEIAPEKPARANTPKKPPSRQASPADKGSGQPKAPKKPDRTQPGGNKPAPNSPSKIKAPAKPKKRF